MGEMHDQLRLFGFDEVIKQAKGDSSRSRLVRAAAEILVEPDEDDLSFLHSGLCQTALPHTRPADNSRPWERRSAKVSLIVEPGTVRSDNGVLEYVGVPYGSKARLIMIYLQSEGVKSQVVPLGSSMSAWMRSLGLAVTGGKKGTIREVKEQVLRIANCSLKLEWEDEIAGGIQTSMERTTIVRGLKMWAERPGREKWPTHVELSREFHEHLQAHAIPLDKRAIAHLAGNSFALDLYATLAYRLPRLEHPTHVRWAQLQGQFGSNIETTHQFAYRLRKILPAVLTVYEGAQVEVSRHGLTLKPSKPTVPKTTIQGHGLKVLPDRD
jgi:hypothetical protein